MELCKIVGIGGVSRAGKSTLATLLSERIKADHLSVRILHQDEYVMATEDIPMIKDKRNWELPGTIDWDRLEQAIEDSRSLDYLFVEGLFAFNNKRINDLYSYKILVEISKSKFVHRKKEDLRWGAKPEPDWYIEHIWTSYLTYGRPTLSPDYITVNGSRHFDIESIYSLIHS